MKLIQSLATLFILLISFKAQEAPLESQSKPLLQGKNPNKFGHQRFLDLAECNTSCQAKYEACKKASPVDAVCLVPLAGCKLACKIKNCTENANTSYASCIANANKKNKILRAILKAGCKAKHLASLGICKLIRT